MKNKFLTIFLLIIMILCIFNIKTYASSNYIVFDESTNMYHLDFNFKEEFNLEIANATTYYEYPTSDIYFLLTENSDSYELYTSSKPFVHHSFNWNNSSAYFVSDGIISQLHYNCNTKVWSKLSEDVNATSISCTISLSTVVASSHDIINKDGSGILINKYEFSNNEDVGSGESGGNTGDSGNTEEIKGTNEAADYVYSDHFHLSSIYNNSWIESYLDLNQNPVDGIKKLINSHQNYFNFTSSELGGYWVCEKINFTNDNGYFYYFLIAPGPLYSDYYYNRHHDYMFSGKEDVQCFPIIFVENGFYAPSTLCNKNSGGYECGSGYGYVFSNDIEYTGTNTSAYIILSNHDIYDARFDETLVFTGPVTKNGTTLAPVIQRERTKGTIQVALKEIIAVLPIILMIIVGLIGLRKALKMLSMVFHRS